MDVTGTTATVKDPVCGKEVVPGIARGWDYRFNENVYHFCGSECRNRFQQDPKQVLSAGPVVEQAAHFQSKDSAFQKVLTKIRNRFF
jgi:YHS domain-containing protein